MTALAAAAAVAALVQGAFRVPALVADATALRGTSRLERSLAPAREVKLPAAVLTGAARAVPRDARYTVVVGDRLPLPGALNQAIKPLLYHWLLPRRYVKRPANADWVIVYGASPADFGAPLGRRIELAPGAFAAEVEP